MEFSSVASSKIKNVAAGGPLAVQGAGLPACPTAGEATLLGHAVVMTDGGGEGDLF